jgi:hypothetical protein
MSDQLTKWIKAARRKGRLFDVTGRLCPPLSYSAWWMTIMVPLLASRIADRLERKEAPPPLADDDIVTAADLATRELISVEQWNECMRVRLAGAQTRAAIKRAGISETCLRRYLHFEPRLRVRWAYVGRGMRQRRWPPSRIEQILAEIAAGSSMCAAVAKQAAPGRAEADRQAFIALKARSCNKELEQKYLSSAEIRQARGADEILRATDEAPDNSRATRRGLWQMQHRLDGMRPHRFFPRKQLSEAQVRLKEARRRVKAAKKKAL